MTHEVINDMTTLIKELNQARADAAEWKRKYFEVITKTSDKLGFPRVTGDEGGD